MGKFSVKRRELVLVLASGLCLLIFAGDLLWMLVWGGQLNESDENLRMAVFTANIIIQLMCFFLLLLIRVMDYSGLCALVTMPALILALVAKIARVYIFAAWKLEEKTGRVPMETIVAVILLLITLILVAMTIYLIVSDRSSLKSCTDPEEVWCCFCTLEECRMGCDEIKDSCGCCRTHTYPQILMENGLGATDIVDLSMSRENPRQYWTRRGSIDPLTLLKQMDRRTLAGSVHSSRSNSPIAESDILPLLPDTNMEIMANIYTCNADIITGKIYFNQPFTALLDLHCDLAIRDPQDLCGSLIKCKCVNTDSKKLQTTKDYIARCLPEHGIRFNDISDLELTQFYSANSERFLKRQALAEDLCRTFFDCSDKLRKSRPHIKMQPTFLAHLPDPQMEFLALEQEVKDTGRFQIVGPDGYPDVTEKSAGPKNRQFILKVFALVHWSYSKFNEEAIICDIQGVDCYITRLALSCEKRSHVRPEEANRECVENFKKTHQCNKYCKMAALIEFKRPANSTSRSGDVSSIPKPKFSAGKPTTSVSRLAVNKFSAYKSSSPRPGASPRPGGPSPRPGASPRPSVTSHRDSIASSRTGKSSPPKIKKIQALTPRSLIKVTEANASSTINSLRK